MDPISDAVRHRRRRVLVVAGLVGGAGVLAAAIVPGVIDGDEAQTQPSADLPGEHGETTPPDGPDVRPRDLAPEQVPQLPGATVAQAVIGADLDHRAVVWQARNRQVLAVTTDGGDSWTHTGEAGQYFDLSGHADPTGVIGVSVDGGGRGRTEAIIGPDGEVVELAPPRGLAPVAGGDLLVMHLPRRNAERQVAVDADGVAHYWPGDPWFGERRTGVHGAWALAERMPSGAVVQQVAGPQADFGGFCCAARPVIRWSQDGGATWSTRELDSHGAAADAIHPFTISIPSLDPDTIAVHESTEGGTRIGRPLLATQRFAVDGTSAHRFEGQFPSTRVRVTWSVVLPGGELLVWAESGRASGPTGPWLSEGDDWSAMAPAPEYAAPSGVDADGLVLADVHLADGRARVVAVAPSGEMLVIEDDRVGWTHVAGD